MTAELFKAVFPTTPPPPLLRIRTPTFILFQITQALIQVSVFLNRGIIYFCSHNSEYQNSPEKDFTCVQGFSGGANGKNSPARFICRCIY